MKRLRTLPLSRLVKHLSSLALVLAVPLLTPTAVLGTTLFSTTLFGAAVFSSAHANAAQDAADFNPAQLDQMLAPIALYPDALLSQVLIASTYPLEVIQADRWVRSNKDLKADDALKFAQNKDWDPSVKALVAFPDILQRMSDDVNWTQSLGDAFLNNEGEVMDAVQRLRKRAYASGNLEKAQHISVERDDNHIIIEPAQERIVYVPVYDTRVVYGNWWWPDYPPVYWRYPSNYTYVSGFYWGSSIHLGSSYFYSSCHWRDRRVVVIDRHNHYGADTRFYTGRSIIRSGYTRNWSHDPVHRQGVAYHNNRLRDNYGSQRPSYQDDRQYRAQHRDAGRDTGRDVGRGDRSNNPSSAIRTGNHHDANNRYESPHTGNGNDRQTDRAVQFDRAEQVRARLDRTNNGNSRNENPNSRGDNPNNRGDNLGGTNTNSGWVNTDRAEQNNPNRTQNRPSNTTTTNFALPASNTDNRNLGNINARNDDSMNRQRAALQAERANFARERVNTAQHANPEPRINTEQRFNREHNAHPDFSGASARTEPPARDNPPQQRMERRADAAPEQREASPSPQRAEGLAEQRAARAENSNSRFAR